MPRLNCPRCGHHIGDLATPKPPAQPAKDFITSRIRQTRGKILTSADLWDEYVKSGGTLSHKALGMAMLAQGYTPGRTKSARLWLDAELVDSHS